MITFRRSRALLIAIALVGSLFLLSSCTHRQIVQLGSHKVTIARHGFAKKLLFNPKATVPTLEFKGVSTAGIHFKVNITGDKVKVNDLDYGKLRAGDSVLIGDEGIAVNDLDYGESEKYLRANSSAAESTAQN
jgi:hypothetical protein